MLHRAREHLKEPGCSSVFRELLTKKLSRLKETSGGCEQILPVSGSSWSSLKLVKIMFLTAWFCGWCDVCSAVCWSIFCARSRPVMTAESG